MIHTEVIPNIEKVISDYRLEQLPKWKTPIRDGRINSDVGKFGISLFDLDQTHIEPIFLVAKIERTGTTVKTYLRTELSNGDFLELKCVEIHSKNEKDEWQAITPVRSFHINGKDSGYHKRYIDFDSAREFYINEWIPSQNPSIV